MKKLIVTLTLLSALVAAVFGQSFSTDYVQQNNFPGVRIENGRMRGGYTKYTDDISIEDEELFGALDGNGVIDKPHELVAASAVLNIRDVAPADALKCYAEIAIEGAANSFLRKETTHTQVLARLQSKYGFTRTEIDRAVGACIAEIVDAEAAKRQPTNPATIAEIKRIINNFYLNPTRANFDVLAQKARAYGLTDGQRGKNAHEVLVDTLLGFNTDFGDAVMNPARLAQ